MISLISPEHNFEQFCRRMFGKDPMEVIELASAEITNARRNHPEQTDEPNVRRGSKGLAYCDDLQRLISLFTGSVPDNAPAEFLDPVKPLALDLLKRWEIVSLRQIVADQPDRPRSLELGGMADFLTVVISKHEVDTGEISGPLGILRRLIESPTTARQFAERVDIVFHGYDDVPQELFEIQEVRSFVARLDEEFPYWLFFLSKSCLGLQCLFFCFLPPSLTETARARVFPSRIGELLTRRWFPAMNHICNYAGFSELEVKALTDRVEAYITRGKLAMD